MKTAAQAFDLTRALHAGVPAAVGLAGAWYSYDFGAALGGVLMGVLAAGNAAVMAALLSAALLDRLAPERRD